MTHGSRTSRRSAASEMTPPSNARTTLNRKRLSARSTAK